MTIHSVIGRLIAYSIALVLSMPISCEETPPTQSKLKHKPAIRQSAPIVTPIVHKPSISEKGLKILKAVIWEDLKSYTVDCNETAIKWNTIMNIQVEATSRDVSKEYRDNEVSADEKYKSKAVRLSGPITAIKRDMKGNVYVSLKGHDFLREVQAYLGKDSVAKAKELKRGDDVTLFCMGLGVQLMTPAFGGCSFGDEILQQVYSLSVKVIDLWFEGKAKWKGSDNELSVLFFFYFVGTKMKDSSPCFKKDLYSPACVRDIERSANGIGKNNKELSKLRSEFAAWLKLPTQ